MELTERQSRIMASARREQRVDVDALAREYDVTTQTIRRDLNELCLRGLLTRVHGGAMLRDTVKNVTYEERRSVAFDAKRAIGELASSLIPNSCSLIMNIGTTVEQVARGLYEHHELVLVTNNINIINVLSGSPDKELILAGGVVRQSDGAIVGEAAVEFIRQFKVDYAIIGASALDEDGSVMDFDIREVSVARAIIENARHTILAADHHKFERNAPVRICDMESVDTFVTDRTPPARFSQACVRAGTRIMTTEAIMDEWREASNEH